MVGRVGKNIVYCRMLSAPAIATKSATLSMLSQQLRTGKLKNQVFMPKPHGRFLSAYLRVALWGDNGIHPQWNCQISNRIITQPFHFYPFHFRRHILLLGSLKIICPQSPKSPKMRFVGFLHCPLVSCVFYLLFVFLAIFSYA